MRPETGFRGKPYVTGATCEKNLSAENAHRDYRKSHTSHSCDKANYADHVTDFMIKLQTRTQHIRIANLSGLPLDFVRSTSQTHTRQYQKLVALAVVTRK